MTIELGALLGFAILVADLIAIIGIGRSSTAVHVKVLWILAVLLLPVIGFIGWWLTGPRALPAAKDLVKPGSA